MLRLFLLFYRYVPNSPGQPTRQFSMPSFGSVTKIVKVPDTQGIECMHPVNEMTLSQIRLLLLTGSSTRGMTPVQGSKTYPSVGSLHSTTSYQSSQASIGLQPVPQMMPGYVSVNSYQEIQVDVVNLCSCLIFRHIENY